MINENEDREWFAPGSGMINSAAGGGGVGVSYYSMFLIM